MQLPALYSPSSVQGVLNISPIILVEKISKLIKSLFNRKALKLYSILNKILKIIILIIVKNLIEVVNYYFISRIILKSLKEFIIIVLHKEKKRLFFPKQL